MLEFLDRPSFVLLDCFTMLTEQRKTGNGSGVRAINLLEELEIPRVDLVEHPAVNRRFLLLKDSEVNDMAREPQDLEEVLKEETSEEVAEAGNAAAQESEEQPTTDQGESSGTDRSTEEPVFEAKAALTEAERGKVKEAVSALSGMEDIVGRAVMARLSSLVTGEEKTDYPEAKKAEGMEEKLIEALGKEEAQRVLDALRKQEEEITKAAESEREQLQKQVVEAEGRIEELTKAVTEEKRKREEREFVDSIQKDIRSVPGVVDENARLLFSISQKVEKEEFDKLVDILKSASAVIQKSGFLEELGSSASSSEPEGILEARAKEKVQKDAGLTMEQAKARVLQEDPELYRSLRNANQEVR